MRLSSLALIFVFGLIGISQSAFAFSVSGKGHYTLRGETRTHPAFSQRRGMQQAIDQDLRLSTEFRATDKASFVAEWRLFDDPRAAYLGDEARPTECSPKDNTTISNSGNAKNCDGRHQSTTNTGYAPYYPKVTEAYALYALDFCLVKAGRRSREWGMGIFLDSDHKPFSTASSIYDGISCDINIQKAQTLAMSFGYDKLAETGANTDELAGPGGTYGGSRPSDDLDQYFFTIQYDDRKANAGSRLTQQVGIYFANITGGGDEKTDLKFADLFASFFLEDWVLKQEILFRLGKTADPSMTRLGGAGYQVSDGSPAVNKTDAIAAAGSLEYTMSRSGSVIGPAEYRKGNATSHALFFEYAYAPGDNDGYTDILAGNGAAERTDTKASAVAFHRNFKPALILFNERPENDDLRVDGVFDPGRVMNAFVWGTGYRYKNLESGNFEIKLISAKLNEGMPSSVKALYANAKDRPVGYGGNDLGWELDLKYDSYLAHNLQWGLNGGIALPGDAWDIREGDKQKYSFLVQSFINFEF